MEIKWRSWVEAEESPDMAEEEPRAISQEMKPWCRGESALQTEIVMNERELGRFRSQWRRK